MKYLDKQYKKINKYNQFMKSPGSAYDRGFLYDINTWEDLRRLNEDWYEIVYNKYKDSLCKDAINAMNKLEINDKIKNLRNLICFQLITLLRKILTNLLNLTFRFRRYFLQI